MIDPAKSFSQALGQGLGIMKSYRDEARQDEDRTFDKQLRMRVEERLEKALQLEVDAGRRDQEEHDWEYGKDPQTGLSKADEKFTAGQALTIAQGDSARAIAKQEEFKAREPNMQRMFDLGVREVEANIRQSDAAAASSRASAGYYSEQTTASREERLYKARRNAFFNVIGAASRNDMGAFRNNAAALPAVGQIAANVLNAPSLMEAIRNPTGSWVNDPTKVTQVFSFSKFPVENTARAAGLRSGGRGGSGPRLINPRAGSRNIDGRNVSTIEFQIAGIDAGTGKPRTIDRFARTEEVLDAGVAAVKIHRQLAASPDAQRELINQLSQDPENRKELNAIVTDRVELLKGYIKGRDEMDESVVAARTELAQLTGTNLGAFPEGGTAHARMKDENTRVVVRTIFHGLGRVFQD